MMYLTSGFIRRMIEEALTDHACGSRSNIDDSDTFKALQMANSRAALTRFTPFSYF